MDGAGPDAGLGIDHLEARTPQIDLPLDWYGPGQPQFRRAAASGTQSSPAGTAQLGFFEVQQAADAQAVQPQLAAHAQAGRVQVAGYPRRIELDGLALT